MNKILFSILLLSMATTVSAKEVKFAVDMTGQTVSPNGVHVAGDFQEIAGYAGGDWVANTTTLTQEGSTNIYSITINLPAFAKYEYKFVNGDQFYETEFVPVESRVGYDFNDSRWIYLDSTDNGVFFPGAILFAGNAPAGKTMIRFLVNMQDQSVSSNGIHVAGNFQGTDPAKSILYSFGNDIYEAIYFSDAGTISYKFYNGNVAGNAETVPSACAANGNREIALSADVVLDVVCFSSCEACISTAGMEENELIATALYPNPTQHSSVVKVDGNFDAIQVRVLDLKGSIMYQSQETGNQFVLTGDDLNSGIYFVQLSSAGKALSTSKWVIQ